MSPVFCSTLEHATAKRPSPRGGARSSWLYAAAGNAASAATAVKRVRNSRFIESLKVESPTDYGRHPQAPAHPLELQEPRGGRPFSELVPAKLLRREIHAGARVPDHSGQSHV